ncbi:CHAT domain-containing protein [Nocardia higoensis]|uniref:CHAT domain-containing protein n=1 Tax=Nocardia higoensis TaxID=228599 RepID=UPI00030B089A|nr:CHAT domain-containing protein [Nocardia higoensis]
MTDPVDVLVRATDAGDTYLSWRWLDDPAHPEFAVLPAARVGAADELLAAGLPTALPGETAEAGVRRALISGPFATPAGERALSAALTDVVFPQRLREQIAARARASARVRVRFTPSPRLARIPWELLFVTAGQRLLEVAEFVHEPPAAVHAERPRLPEEWQRVRERPALLVIDPPTPRSAVGYGPVLDRSDQLLFLRRLSEHAAAGRVPRAERASAIRASTRHDLSAALAVPRSRLFYLGHVSARSEEPGSAALHLSDTAQTWGEATPLSRVGPDGIARVDPRDHRPLAALDLFLGTVNADEPVWRSYGSTGPRRGHELWPMPPRVAMIVCEGHADFRAEETFGLVVAMIHAGAGLVTTTRWTLPADREFRRLPGVAADARPVTELALRVDAAHECADPVAELTAWQRDRLRAWCGDSADPTGTPLVWASPTHTIAPARAVVDTGHRAS